MVDGGVDRGETGQVGGAVLLQAGSRVGRMSTVAREGYVVVALASAVALVAFVVAAVVGSWAIWLGAYLFVIVTLLVTFLAFREAKPAGEENGAEPVARADGGGVAAEDFREASQ